VGLRRAIHSALHTPIDSWIPDYMKFDHVCERTAEIVEGDWLLKGQQEYEKRLSEGGDVSCSCMKLSIAI
jgi:hypothetical protein